MARRICWCGLCHRVGSQIDEAGVTHRPDGSSTRSAGPLGPPRSAVPLCRGPLGPYACPVTDLDELLELAQSIVVRVMATLADTRAGAAADPQSLVHATKSTNTDMVTEMDLWAERHITEALVAARPHDAIVGEEGTRREGSTGVHWYVDPIDGTTNYLYGHPGYSVSIGASVDGELALGVVGDPTLGEVFRAAARRRCVPQRRRDRRVERARHCRTLWSVPVSAIGPTGAARRRWSCNTCSPRCAISAAWAGLRSICVRSPAADSTRIYEYGISSWDIAAGTVIALESGAAVTDLAGRPTLGPMIVAAGAPLHGELCDLLRSAHADQMPT